MNTKTFVALIVIAIIAIGGYFTPVGKTVVTETVGAVSGPLVQYAMEFRGGVTFGHALSTSTPASMTLKLADVRGFDTVIVKPTGAASAKTLTFFASSTAATWLPNAGDTQKTCFVNATTTAGVNLVFAAGTGIDLQTASSSPTDLTLLPDNAACFTFTRKAKDSSITNSFDIMASFVEYTDGD